MQTTSRIAHKYYDMRDELILDNGFPLKGSNIIFPAAFRQPFLHDLYEEHTGIPKFNLLLSSLLYWPGIDRHMEDCGKWCPTCIKLLSPLPAEPLINHDVLHGPWQRIGAGFMDWDNKGFLLIVGHFF